MLRATAAFLEKKVACNYSTRAKEIFSNQKRFDLASPSLNLTVYQNK